ncbi:MAG: rhodanese-like domain-containing protein [Planctomycetes bacterium]|nr:rhodanese-like domain-containing protein [Planctomycetota bacterium]
MSERGPLESALPVITAAGLRARLEGGAGGWFLLDTRPLAEFEKGHVPGSFHCPVHELSKRARLLPPKGWTVIVVGEAGKRGVAGALFLVLAGWTGVALLEGGWPAWDGPVETGPPRPLSEAHPRKPPGWVDPP